MMDHLSNLQNMFGGDDGDEYLHRTKPAKGWTQVIFDKRTDFTPKNQSTSSKNTHKDDTSSQDLNSPTNWIGNPTRLFDFPSPTPEELKKNNNLDIVHLKESSSNSKKYQYHSDDLDLNLEDEEEPFPLLNSRLRQAKSSVDEVSSPSKRWISTSSRSRFPIVPNSPYRAAWIRPGRPGHEKFSNNGNRSGVDENLDTSFSNPMATLGEISWGSPTPGSSREHQNFEIEETRDIPLTQGSIESVPSPSQNLETPQPTPQRHGSRHRTNSGSVSRKSSERKRKSRKNSFSTSHFPKIRRLSSILDSPEKHGTRIRRLPSFMPDLNSPERPGYRERDRDREKRYNSSSRKTFSENKQTCSSNLISSSSSSSSSNSASIGSVGSDSTPFIFLTPEKPKKSRDKFYLSPSVNVIPGSDSSEEQEIQLNIGVHPFNGNLDSPPVKIDEPESPERSPSLSPVMIRRSQPNHIQIQKEECFPLRLPLSPKSLFSKLAPFSSLLSQSSNSNSDPEHLSQRISEDLSTQSEELSSPFQTPIDQWIRNETQEVDINFFESPFKYIERRLGAEEENNVEMADVAARAETELDFVMLPNGKGKERTKFNLGEQMKTIMTRYEASVRMFPHNHRLGRFNEGTSITLIVRNICGREDCLVWTVCYNLTAREDRCVLFKPHFPQEIILGAVLKLYQPWKDLSIPGIEKDVIICADFYKLIPRFKEELGLTKELIEHLKSQPLPQGLNHLKMIPYTEEMDSTFISMIPYSIKNTRTITKQIDLKKKQSLDVDLEVVVVKSCPWKYGTQSFLLDSDGVFSLMEIEAENSDSESPALQKQQILLEALKSPGKFIKFDRLAVNRKIYTSENAALFCVLRALLVGVRKKVKEEQIVCYVLSLQKDTEWKIYQDSESPIKYKSVQCQRKFIHEIRQMMEECDEERVSIECLVVSATEDVIKIEDKLGYGIELKTSGNSTALTVLLETLSNTKQLFVIDFLRVPGGELPIVDEYSIIDMVDVQPASINSPIKQSVEEEEQNSIIEPEFFENYSQLL